MTTAVLPNDTLPNESFKLVQSVLRWAAIGAQPAVSVAKMAKDALSSVKDAALAPAVAMLEELSRGILPAQDKCLDAEKRLVAFQQSHASVDAVTPFGDVLLHGAQEGQR